MKLYSKKLDGLDALEREKLVISKRLRELDKEELFSIEAILEQKKKEFGFGGGQSRSLLEWIPSLSTNPLLGRVVKVVRERLAHHPEKKQEQPKQRDKTPKTGVPGEKQTKNVIKSVAVEIIGGYLKWKAIELSYKGVRYLIAKNKEKKKEASV